MKSDSNFHLVPVFFQDFLKSYHYPVFFPEVVSKLYDSYFSCQGARKINNSTKEYKDNAIDQVMDNYLFYWMMNKPDTLLEKKNAFESLLNNELFPYGYTGRTKAHVTRLKTELEDFLDGSKYELFSITHNTCLDEQVLLQKTTICFLEYICNRYIAQLRSIEQQVSPTSTETVQKILDILSQLIDEMHNSPE
ncbi:MAG: hypothetical protein FJ161_00825, partial [Gammaproteobacteria bacterium]|nr:hypothetical protein [Gammaproteobacteria bacterium]